MDGVLVGAGCLWPLDEICESSPKFVMQEPKRMDRKRDRNMDRKEAWTEEKVTQTTETWTEEKLTDTTETWTEKKRG
jgi:hypothetical protein